MSEGLGVVAVDLFAGPGGTDLGARSLGIDPLGIEWDDAAVATRRAAGLRTLQGDVAALDPVQVFADHINALRRADWEQAVSEGHGDPASPPEDLDPTTCLLLIASPPCQAFSMAGNGAGRRALDAYAHVIGRMAKGWNVDYAELDRICEDRRAHLVLEPLRWAVVLKPRWIALEQVEPVLPLWEAMAQALRTLGYHTWTGVLSAEQYGVPQTRKRAILLASLDGPVDRPAPTHQRYIPPRRVEEATDSLFDAGEPERIVAPEDRHLLPWRSMAEALGWMESEWPSPAPTVTSGGTAQGGVEVFASKASRARVGRAVSFRATNDRPNAAEREADEPGPSLAFGHNPPRWLVSTGNTKGGTRPEGLAREADEPAHTVTGRADQMEWRDGEHPTHLNTGRDWKPGGTREDAQKIPVDQPAPAVSVKFGGQSQWVHDRPATTVAGDPRVHPPGHKVNGDDVAAGRDGYEERRGENAIRVSIAEAAVLQSFPPDYPWCGTKTKVFEQIGNAVPPLLARAFLSELLPVERPLTEAA